MVLIFALFAAFGRLVLAQTPLPRDFDIIILLDVSTSTGNLDPNNLRVQTTNFLIEYLQAALGDFTDSQLAIVPFAGEANDTWAWQPLAQTQLLSEATLNQFVSSVRPGTNFEQALTAVVFDAGSTRKKLVFLVTDGEPDVSSNTLVGALERNLSYLQTQVAPSIADFLSTIDAELYVVGAGARLQYEAFWGGGNYLYLPVRQSGDLVNVLALLTALVDLPAGIPRTMAAGNLTFNLSQDDLLVFLPDNATRQTSQTVTLTRNGSLYETLQLGGSASFYLLRELPAGDWQINYTGSQGRLIQLMGLQPTATPTFTPTASSTPTPTSSPPLTNTPTRTPLPTTTYTPTPLPTLFLEFSDSQTAPIPKHGEAVTFTLSVTSSIPYTVAAYLLPGGEMLGTFVIKPDTDKLVIPLDEVRCKQARPVSSPCGEQAIQLVGSGVNLGRQKVTWMREDHIVIQPQPLLDSQKHPFLRYWPLWGFLLISVFLAWYYYLID